MDPPRRPADPPSGPPRRPGHPATEVVLAGSARGSAGPAAGAMDAVGPAAMPPGRPWGLGGPVSRGVDAADPVARPAGPPPLPATATSPVEQGHPARRPAGKSGGSGWPGIELDELRRHAEAGPGRSAAEVFGLPEVGPGESRRRTEAGPGRSATRSRVEAGRLARPSEARSAQWPAAGALGSGLLAVDLVEPSGHRAAAVGCPGTSMIEPAPAIERPAAQAGVAVLVGAQSDPRRSPVGAVVGSSQLRARRAAAGPVGKPVEVPQRPVAGAGSAVRVHRHVRPPIRLTRRGRVVIALALAVLATALVAGLVALAPSAGRAAAPPAHIRPLVAVVVHPGDTLWSIASRSHPTGSVFAAMDEIKRINHLSDGTVYVGQQLLVPAPA